MTLVLTSLALLALGAATSLLLARLPRLALNLAMLLAFVAAVLVVITAGDVLLRSSTRGPYEAAWPLSLGTVRLSLDGLSAWFLMTIGVLAACIAIYTVPYMSSAVGREPVPVFCALFCGLLAALILLVCAADAVLFLIAWEVMTLTAFLLVGFHHAQPEVRRGAWMYLVATHIGTALFVLPLFGILFARAGTTAFSSFAGAVGSGDDTTLVTLFALGLVGFGTKAGFMPMHVWLPAAHPVAPTPVSAFLSGVVVKTGIYGLLRLLTWLPPLPLVCGEVLLLVGVVSGVMGVLYALAQHGLKRLLAYHTVENIGIIALGIAVGLLGEATNEPTVAVLGYAGALLHVTNHALFKGLLFLSAGTVLHGSGTGKIERLGGLARKTPANALMFLIGAVAICGLPPLNGFLSEWVIYGSLFGGSIRGIGASGGLPAVGVAALALMGGLALACFAKVFGVVFLGEPREAGLQTHATPAGMKIAMAALGLFCLLIGMLPGLWVPLVRSATGELANVPAGEISTQIESVLSPVIRLSGIAALFVLAVGGLYLLRRWAMSHASRRDVGVASTVATWGCGYTQPTPRMQYTASSFAQSLIATFRSLLWPERSLVAPAGSFPAASLVETHAPDIAEHEFFEPIFRGVARLCAMVRTVSWRGEQESPQAARSAAAHRRGPVGTLIAGLVSALRRGSIQVRLLFIVLTLVVLFLVEAISFGGQARSALGQDSRPTLRMGADR
jgi:hydrogenase-4 component B